MTDNKQTSEFELIDWIASQQSHSYGDILQNIGDDMAIMQTKDEKLLITTDMLLEGRHFDLSQATLEEVGYKAMAASLSDCAAMASVPLSAVIAVALPKTMELASAKKLHSGIQKASRQFSCPVIGGDTTSWDKPLAINVTMLSIPLGITPILRSGALTDDAIMVTGTLGGSLKGKHLNFTPRIAEARKLAGLYDIHSMMDISDGIAGDLRHICKASNVSALLITDNIPISDSAKTKSDPLTAALSDGEDFELLFTLSARDAEELIIRWDHEKLQITQVGTIIETIDDKATIYTKEPDGTSKELNLTGWQH